MKQYTRQQVKERLLSTIARKDSIIIAGTGSGMSARQAEIGGADLVGLYSTSFFRMEGIYGMPSFAPVIDNNQVVLDLVRSVAPAIKEVPVIAGIMANDPTRDLGKLYDELKSIGCSCIMNFPLTGDHSGVFVKLWKKSVWELRGKWKCSALPVKKICLPSVMLLIKRTPSIALLLELTWSFCIWEEQRAATWAA